MVRQHPDQVTNRLSGQAHMTVDEKVMQPGMSQRRPDAHVDGQYLPDAGMWGHPPGPSWVHYCNNIPFDRMSVIVAASVPGCIAYVGEFEGEPKSDGDLEHIRDQLGDGVLLPANQGFLLSPDCVHESVRFKVQTKRSKFRLIPVFPEHSVRILRKTRKKDQI